MFRPAKGYKFEGMKPVLKSIAQRRKRESDLPLDNIGQRRARIEDALGGTNLPVVYFSVPTPRVSNLRYAQAFCENFSTTPCIDHSDTKLIRKLNHRRYWYDDGHLLKRGADTYTRWLARQVGRELHRRDGQK